MEDTYYYEAVDDVNENGYKYTNYSIRPTEWRELVYMQEIYLMTIDQLSQYIFDDDERILNIFQETCRHYDDD